MRMQLLGVCALVAMAGAAAAADKPKGKKDKPTTTPPTSGATTGNTQLGTVAGALLGSPPPADKPRTAKGGPTIEEFNTPTEKYADAKFTVTKPVGTWVRDVQLKGGAVRVRLTIADDRLTLKAELTGGMKTATVQFDADYAINKESCLFGVLDTFSTDLPLEGEAGKALALSGQPFAVRFRADEKSLSVKEFKGFGVGIMSSTHEQLDRMMLAVCGQYAAVDPSKPLPPLKASGNSSSNSDPLIRQEQLLNQSESFGQPGSTIHIPPCPASPPSHLTPQRIHGGILKADPPKEEVVTARLGGLPLPTPHYLKHYPTYFAPDPVSPNDKERDKPLDPTGELKQAKAEEVADDAAECEPPSDAEVLEVFNARRKKKLGDKYAEFQDDITIVKNLVTDKIDAPRAYLVMGTAQLHRCQWECGVYFNEKSADGKTRKPKVEAVFITTDSLRVVPVRGEVVPQRMPEQ